LARFYIRRRYYTVLGLGTFSVVWWILAWRRLNALSQAAHDPMSSVLLQVEEGIRASWSFVAIIALLHSILGLLGWRRGDREMMLGVLMSAALHLIFMFGSGILRF